MLMTTSQVLCANNLDSRFKERPGRIFILSLEISTVGWITARSYYPLYIASLPRSVQLSGCSRSQGSGSSVPSPQTRDQGTFGASADVPSHRTYPSDTIRAQKNGVHSISHTDGTFCSSSQR